MQTKSRGYICVHIPWLQPTLNLTLGQMDLDALALRMANGVSSAPCSAMFGRWECLL